MAVEEVDLSRRLGQCLDSGVGWCSMADPLPEAGVPSAPQNNPEKPQTDALHLWQKAFMNY